MSFEPFLPRTLDVSAPARADAGLHRGYQEGLELARIEAVAQARAEVRNELAALIAERDAAAARAAGSDAAFETERQQVRRTLEQLNQASSALEGAVQFWASREATSVDNAHRQVVEFAIELAGLIVKSYPVDVRLRAALDECLTLHDDQGPVRVRVNPSCVRTLEALPHTWNRALLTIVPDEAVAPGSVVCESGPSRLEAGLDVSLRRVRNALGVADL
jgi:flagellar biosynthesis/type III secretory pathway protein FliH